MENKNKSVSDILNMILEIPALSKLWVLRNVGFLQMKVTDVEKDAQGNEIFLSGARYELKSREGNTIYIDGNRVKEIPDDFYTITEINPPFGYNSIKEVKNITIKKGESLELPYKYSKKDKDKELTFTYNNVSKKYQGVKVGEYIWMNANLHNDYSNSIALSTTKEKIQKWYSNNIVQGVGDNVDIKSFNQYYGLYYKSGIANNLISQGQISENGIINKAWKLPSSGDILQLIAMCGNATLGEVRQYLSKAVDDTKITGIVGASYWFASITMPYASWLISETDGYSSQNLNKYQLNFMPTGMRATSSGVGYTTGNDGKVIQFPYDFGDFLYLNLAIYLKASDGVFMLDDIPRMSYNKYDYNYYPVRFCRPLTDQELGYKLYINQNMSSLDGVSGEEILLDDIRSGRLDPAKVIVKKLGLSESIPQGYCELPRGYIRGFYVQYVIDRPEGNQKTIASILNIAKKNIYLWKGTGLRSTLTDESSLLTQEEISIYPSPVQNRLYLKSSDKMSYVEMYSINGVLCYKKEIEENYMDIDMSTYPSGFYILKINAGNKLVIRKIQKI